MAEQRPSQNDPHEPEGGETPAPDEEAPDPGEQHEHIPLEPSPRSEGPPSSAHGDKLREGRIDRPSLLEESTREDRCPACGKPLPGPEAVVCTNCGYDLGAARHRSTQVGDVEVDEFDAEGGVLVRAKPLGAGAPSVIGLLGVVLGAALAGAFAETREIRAVLGVLLYGPLLAGLGVAAVALAASLLEKRIGRLDVATGRMLACVGLFAVGYYLCQGIPAHALIQFIIGAGLGLGLYLGFAKLTFRLPNPDLMMLLGLHFLMWLLFRLLLIAIAWLENPPLPPEGSPLGN